MLNAIGVGSNVIEKYPQTQIMYPGGNVVSFAYFAGQLGCRSAYLGSLANDLAGMHIKTTLMSLNIDVSHCKSYQGKTRETEVNIVNGDRVYREIPCEPNSSSKLQLTNYDYQYISNFHLLLTDCVSKIEDDLPNIKELGVPILFDFSDSWTLEYLERVCPNVYLSFLSCPDYSDDEIRDVLKKAVEFGSKIAIATMGGRGAILYNGIRFYKRNAVRVRVIDTVGAGSAFLTCFIVKYIEALYEEQKAGAVSRAMIEDLTEYALSEASFYAAKVTTKDGPFGYGIEYDDVKEESSPEVKNGKKIVMGVIGADVHAVGNKILNYAFDKAGFIVYNLGVMVSQEEFVQAAIETEADAVLVSSLYGHGELDCRGLRDKCVESGIPDIVMYVGGNLVVGKASFPEVEKKFKDMGFNRVFSNTDPLDMSIALLKQDLGVE